MLASIKITIVLCDASIFMQVSIHFMLFWKYRKKRMRKIEARKKKAISFFSVCVFRVTRDGMTYEHLGDWNGYNRAKFEQNLLI